MSNLSNLKRILQDDSIRSLSFSPWHQSPYSDYYEQLKGCEPGFYMLSGVVYQLTRTPGTTGKGGMDQGSPPYIDLKVIKYVTCLDNL